MLPSKFTRQKIVTITFDHFGPKSSTLNLLAIHASNVAAILHFCIYRHDDVPFRRFRGVVRPYSLGGNWQRFVSLIAQYRDTIILSKEGEFFTKAKLASLGLLAIWIVIL